VPATATETATIAPTGTPAPTATITLTPTATLPPLAEGTVEIRWFVGLGVGSDPKQITVERQVVKDFNAGHPNIHLALEVVANDVALKTLADEIAAGDGADIVGPMGWSSLNALNTGWFSLDALIQDSGYDLSDFDPAVVKSYQTEEGQMALPFMIYPGVVYYQKKLFDAAGLAYPPASYGEKYKMPDGSEVEWNWETLTQIARLLTKDANGRNATEDGFEADHIRQYGYNPQWQSATQQAAYWGPARLYDADRKAVIPVQYKAAWEWYYDGMWGEQPFIPNSEALGTNLLNNTNAFNSGHVAMAVTQSWYNCCLLLAGKNWDLAALPSYKGQVYGRMDTDTFRIWKQTAHPREAFEVLTYLTGPASKQLLDAYEGMPARNSQQEAYLAGLGKKFLFVENWAVLKAATGYVDIPNSDDYAKDVTDRLAGFDELLTREQGLDVDNAIETLRSDLDALFKQ